MTEQDERRVGDRNSLCGLITVVNEFADTDYQQRVWIDGQGPECSSYSEALTELFDNYRVREFANGKAREFGFSEGMIQRLMLLADVLDAFDGTLPPRISNADIIRRKGWSRVVQTAVACPKHTTLCCAYRFHFSDLRY